MQVPKRYVLHTSTPVVRQKPQMNLWLEFASHAHDRILTFLFVISLWCLYCTRLQYTLFRWDSVFDLLSACVPWSLPEDAKQILCVWIYEKTGIHSLELQKPGVHSISIAFNWKVCEIRRGFSYQNERRASVGLLFTHLVFLSTLEYVGMLMQFPEWWPTLRWSRKLPNVIVSGS